MNQRNRTIVLSLLAVLITAGAIMMMKKTAPTQDKSDAKASKKAVRLQEVKLGDNSAVIQFSGKLSAFEKVDMYSEVGGVMLTKGFRDGKKYKKGELIYELDATEFANNLKGQRSNFLTSIGASLGDVKIDFPDQIEEWENFSNKIEVGANLPTLPEFKNAKFKRYVAGKGILNLYYSIKSQEEKLGKFKMYAPYNGIVVRSNVKKGTLVRAGQLVGVYLNPSLYELKTEVSLSDLKFVKPGYEMNLISDDLDQSWKGKVTRVNSSIDPSTQMVEVYVGLSGDLLRDGMYLHGESNGKSFSKSYEINRKLLVNGGVYIVEKGKLKHQKVNVLYASKSKAIVSGLKDGDQLVADNMKGLYEGLEVEVIK